MRRQDVQLALARAHADGLIHEWQFTDGVWRIRRGIEWSHLEGNQRVMRWLEDQRIAQRLRAIR